MKHHNKRHRRLTRQPYQRSTITRVRQLLRYLDGVENWTGIDVVSPTDNDGKGLIADVEDDL